MEHPDQLGTEEKKVDPDDEEEEKLKKKIATIIGDGMGPDGSASLTATISVEMKMSGVNKKNLKTTPLHLLPLLLLHGVGTRS